MWKVAEMDLILFFKKINNFFVVVNFINRNINWNESNDKNLVQFCNKTFLIFIFTGKSIDNSLTQQYQPLEYESSASAPKFLSRGQSYRAVIGDTIVLPCITQDLGKNI